MANEHGLIIIWVMLTIFEMSFFTVFGLVSYANYQNGVGSSFTSENSTAVTYGFNSSQAGANIVQPNFSFIGYIHYVTTIEGIGGWIALFAILAGLWVAVSVSTAIKLFSPVA